MRIENKEPYLELLYQAEQIKVNSSKDNAICGKHGAILFKLLEIIYYHHM